ncbi:MAG TPA: type II secretion system F family protein [Noviherbaspirillum sp.]|jgi:tight adherence protein C|uniref:type II secretion system F family protein n=1 Tax=Noviherbaspirillum sp. TaxID=1926288 RepID=UPI002F92329A
MSDTSILYLCAVFVAVFAASMLLAQLVLSRPGRRRLKALRAPSSTPAIERSGEWVARLARGTHPLASLAAPADSAGISSLRARLQHAGLRDSDVLSAYFAAKTVLAFAAPAMLWLACVLAGVALPGRILLVAALVAAAAGFYLPNVLLALAVARRQRAIFESLPDALDLLTVCIEAGLGIDAGFARVASEIESTCPALAEELQLMTLELRAGQGKEQALRNLGRRTGVGDVDALVAMLIQAEQFGTSVADSLRVHSAHLRTHRRQRAEERAAKVALKLLMPLVFCIFPSLILIMLGPSFIRIGRVLLPSLGGQ